DEAPLVGADAVVGRQDLGAVVGQVDDALREVEVVEPAAGGGVEGARPAGQEDRDVALLGVRAGERGGRRIGLRHVLAEQDLLEQLGVGGGERAVDVEQGQVGADRQAPQIGRGDGGVPFDLV